ncbi:MAG: glycerol-3-phosphate acyltransferase [Anaerolineales bacterium]|nr:glycerol-3-phosphate acyltransferase [Anaerolineales bacterium]
MDNLLTLLYALGFALLGYLSGSLPFAVWITRLVKGVDVREAGSATFDRSAIHQKRATIGKESCPPCLSLAVRRFISGTLGDLLYNGNCEQHIQKS